MTRLETAAAQKFGFDGPAFVWAEGYSSFPLASVGGYGCRAFAAG